MSNSRRLTAVLIAGFSLVLVFGALLTALAETGFSLQTVIKPTNTPIQVGELDPTATRITEPTATEKPSSSEPEADTTKTQKPEATVEKSPTSTATKTPTTPDDGSCTKPDGWKDYKVQSGDTLFGIATLFQTDYPTLQEGNCMGTSTQIITGQILWVPDNATLVPTKDSTATPKPTTKATSKPPVPTSTPKTVTPDPCYALSFAHTGSGAEPIPSIPNSTGCTAGKYLPGEVIDLTASPASGYTVDSWVNTDNDGSTSTSNQITMPSSNVTVKVNYVPICYTLTLGVTSGTGSDPTASPSSLGCTSETYAAGEAITVTSYPGSGLVAIDWEFTNDNTAANLLVIVTADPNVANIVMPAAPATLNVTYGTLPLPGP